MNGKWTDEYLNYMSSLSDALADQTVEELDQGFRGLDGRNVGPMDQATIKAVFRDLTLNSEEMPIGAPKPICDFFEEARKQHPELDYERIDRAQLLFSNHLFEGALVLLVKCLPEGYAAPNLSEILTISDDLRAHPFKRLLGTLELVLNVSAYHGFEKGGQAIMVARKLRLLHAGVRRLTPKYRPQFQPFYGTPVNLEDMLATNIGFSYLMLEGLRTLGIGWRPQQEEDYFYMWRAFSLFMGIHPPGEPMNWEFLPETIEDAAEFYQAYSRRHYVNADLNPHGVDLAKANLNMLRTLVPWPLRMLGLGVLPRIYMRELMSADICDKIGIPQVPKHFVTKCIATMIARITSDVEEKHRHEFTHLNDHLFQKLINFEYGHPVTFTIPASVEDMRGMVDYTHRKM